MRSRSRSSLSKISSIGMVSPSRYLLMHILASVIRWLIWRMFGVGPARPGWPSNAVSREMVMLLPARFFFFSFSIVAI